MLAGVVAGRSHILKYRPGLFAQGYLPHLPHPHGPPHTLTTVTGVLGDSLQGAEGREKENLLRSGAPELTREAPKKMHNNLSL